MKSILNTENSKARRLKRRALERIAKCGNPWKALEAGHPRHLIWDCRDFDITQIRWAMSGLPIESYEEALNW